MVLKKDWFSIVSKRTDSVLGLGCAVGNLIGNTPNMAPSRDTLRVYGVLNELLQLQFKLSISMLRDW